MKAERMDNNNNIDTGVPVLNLIINAALLLVAFCSDALLENIILLVSYSEIKFFLSESREIINWTVSALILAKVLIVDFKIFKKKK